MQLQQLRIGKNHWAIKIKCLGVGLSTRWENTDVCDDHNRCATSLYLFLILSQSFHIIIYCGISAPGHGREVVDGLIATDKIFIFHPVSTFQIPGSKLFDTQMLVHTTKQNTDVSLALEFQKHLSYSSLKHGI